MKNVNGSWNHKPPIFYAIVLVAIGAAVLAIWRQYHPYDYIVWDALIVVFAVAVIVTCLYFVRDWWVDGKERNQLFQQQVQQPTPPPNIAPTKIYEQKQHVVTRRPVKQLPLGNAPTDEETEAMDIIDLSTDLDFACVKEERMNQMNHDVPVSVNFSLLRAHSKSLQKSVHVHSSGSSFTPIQHEQENQEHDQNGFQPGDEEDERIEALLNNLE